MNQRLTDVALQLLADHPGLTRSELESLLRDWLKQQSETAPIWVNAITDEESMHRLSSAALTAEDDIRRVAEDVLNSRA